MIPRKGEGTAQKVGAAREFRKPAPGVGSVPMDIFERTAAWIAADPDPATRKELQALLDIGNTQALSERMNGTLRFGTAGIRGAVEAGSARMNRAVIIRTTAGLAAYLRQRHGPQSVGPVVVGFDARLSSRQFALDTIGVLTAAGFAVRHFPEPTPTPVVAFAGKELGAIATVIVTASHNPPRDNGYKVYDDNGAQIIPPVDEHIATAIDGIGAASSVPRDEPPASTAVEIDHTLFDRYWAAIDAERPAVETGPLCIVYTPLHGVGGQPLIDVLTRAEYDDVHPVPDQFAPDGRFPTVAFPNPEEPGALDLALGIAGTVGADLIVANDPDADRLAVAIPDGAGWNVLTGNQIGVLLAHHVLTEWRHPQRPLVLNSIVSSPMLAEVANLHGAHFEQTLTGFKWISNASFDLEAAGVGRFAIGFEEALGYSIGPVVRDKDGISAALVFIDMVSAAKRRGLSVRDLLEDLARRCGLWVSAQHSIVRPGADGLAEIAAAMGRLFLEQPASIGERDVLAVTDFRQGEADRPRWLPATDLVVFALEGGGRVLVRPSGTEPKLKIYVDLRTDLSKKDAYATQEERMTAQAKQTGAALAEWLGM